MADLFGLAGRRLLKQLEIPEPRRSHVNASLVLIDDLEPRIAQIAKDLRRSGADHRYVPILMSASGLGWITSFTVALRLVTKRAASSAQPSPPAGGHRRWPKAGYVLPPAPCFTCSGGPCKHRAQR